MSSSSPLRCDDGDNRQMGGRSVTCHERRHHRGAEDAAREFVHADVDFSTEFSSLRRSLQSFSGCRCPMRRSLAARGRSSGAARRSRLPPRSRDTSTRRGERCHSFVPRTSYDKPRTSRRSDVTRSRGTFSWLARRWPAERRSWPTSSSSPEHLSPTWTHVARVRPQTRRPTTKSASASKTSRFARPTAVRSFSRPTADGHGDNQDSNE